MYLPAHDRVSAFALRAEPAEKPAQFVLSRT